MITGGSSPWAGLANWGTKRASSFFIVTDALARLALPSEAETVDHQLLFIGDAGEVATFDFSFGPSSCHAPTVSSYRSVFLC